jgi:hypothetical protein
MPKADRLTGGVLALALFAAPALAQIVARQGEVPAVKQFASPMVLELPLLDLATAPKGTTRQFGPEIRNFVCVDVSLVELAVRRRSGRKGSVTLDLSGDLSVRPSHDKRVDLEFQVMAGTAVLGAKKLSDIDAEERRSTPFRGRLSILAETTGVPLLLRVIVSVRRD